MIGLQEWIQMTLATPDRFQQQVDYIEQHPQLDVLGGNIIEFDAEPDQIVAEKQMPLSHEEIIKRLQRRNPFCHMTVFFKKSSVLKAGNYKPLPLVEDYYLWARMAAQGCRFANLNRVLVYARVGNGMHTRRSQTDQIASWKVVNTFFAVTWYVEPRAILSKYVDDSCFCGNAYLDKSVHL